MKHPFAVIFLVCHLIAVYVIAKLAESDSNENGNFIGIFLIGGFFAIADLVIITWSAIRWLFL